MNNYKDIMNGDSGRLLDFDKACDTLIASKFILAESKISNLLQVIAGSKKLYELIETCMSGFDFSGALNELKRNFDGKTFMPLPFIKRKKNIAFTFCLLYSFDTKKIDFQDFLSAYFYSDSNNHEFKKFCDALIVPFRKNIGLEFLGDENDAEPPETDGADSRSESKGKAAKKVNNPPATISASKDLAASDDINDSKEIENIRPGINYSFYEEANNLDEKFLTDIQSDSLLVCAREIIGIVARNPSLSIKEREELLIVLEAFEKAVEFGGLDAIRILYIGVKNTLACSSVCRSLQLQKDSLNLLIEEYEIY